MSLFNVNKTVAGKARNTSVVPMKEDQFLIVTDSGDIFYDSGGKRTQMTDTIVLNTESQRLALTSPFNKFYFVEETGVLWRYSESEWIKCGGRNTSVNKVLTAAGWSNGQQSVAVSGLTAEQDGIVGLSQSVSSEEWEAASSAGLYVCGQTNGTFTIAINGDKPTCDIPITIILFN